MCYPELMLTERSITFTEEFFFDAGLHVDVITENTGKLFSIIKFFLLYSHSNYFDIQNYSLLEK